MTLDLEQNIRGRLSVVNVTRSSLCMHGGHPRFCGLGMSRLHNNNNDLRVGP